MKKKYCYSIILILVTLCTIFFIAFNVRDILGPMGLSDVIYTEKDADGGFVELKNNDTLTLDLVAYQDDISFISIGLDPDRVDEMAGSIDVSVAEAGNAGTVSPRTTDGNVVCTGTISLPGDIDGSGRVRLSIEPGVLRSDVEYIITLKASEDAVLYINTAELFWDKVTVNGTELEQSVDYQLGAVIRGGFSRYITGICIALVIILVIMTVLVIKGTALYKLFPVAVLFFGIIYMTVITPFEAPDEPSHYASAFHYSSVLMGQPQYDSDEKVLVRETDYELFNLTIDGNDANPRLDRESLYTIYDHAGDATAVSEEFGTDTCLPLCRMVNTSFLGYIPQIIGVTAGRLLGLNGLWTYMLGRFIMLIVYAAAGMLVLHLIPFGKAAMAGIMLLPITMQQAISYNYDSNLNVAIFILTAFILYLAYGDIRRISWKECLILFIPVVFIAAIKGMYLGLLLLGLLIPREKFPGGRKALFAAGIVVAAAVLFVLLTGSRVSHTISSAAELSGTADAKFSISEQGIVHTVGIIIRTVYYRTVDYFFEAMGSALGWMEFGVSRLVILIYTIILLLGIAVRGEGDVDVKGWHKLVMIAAGLIISLALYVSLLISWTSAGSPLIQGLQGRYFIPLLLPLLILTRTNTVKVSRNIDPTLMYSITVLECYAVAGILMYAISR